MTGMEWLIEAFGCEEARLLDRGQLALLFETIVRRMELRPIGQPVWHVFDKGGATGIWLLQESHLAIHTFPRIPVGLRERFLLHAAQKPGLESNVFLHSRRDRPAGPRMRTCLSPDLRVVPENA